MPAPPGADVSLEQQQSADELWGPVPNIGVIDFFATDVNDDGVFADTAASREVVKFPDIDWDGDGLLEDGVQDPDSTLE